MSKEVREDYVVNTCFKNKTQYIALDGRKELKYLNV